MLIVVDPEALATVRVAFVRLLLCTFCTFVISPNGPSPVYLIAKPYPTLRLPVVYLPKRTQAQVSELRVISSKAMKIHTGVEETHARQGYPTACALQGTESDRLKLACCEIES